MVLSLVVLFSLPASIITSMFRNELNNGQQMEMLLTLNSLNNYNIDYIKNNCQFNNNIAKKVKISLSIFHNILAWILSSIKPLFILFLAAFTYFMLVFKYNNAFIPSLNLFLCGLSLGKVF